MSWQLVNRLADDAAVLLDLGDRDPWMVTDWSCPPPERRRFAQTSSLYDGSIESGSAHDDRTLNLTLDLAIPVPDDPDVERAGDAAVRRIAELAMLLDRPQWLRYTPLDATRPTYFRLRANTPSSIDERPVHEGKRVVVLTLIAEPFAYGPMVTVQRNVINDPTKTQVAGSAQSSAGFSPGQILGDVPAPAIVSTDGGQSFVLAVRAGGVANDTPDRTINSPTVGNGEEGVTVTSSDQNLSTCAGGVYRRLAYTQGSQEAGTFFDMICDFGQQYVGEYRLFVRARGRDGGSTMKLGPVTRQVPAGTFLVHDLGVVPVGVAGIEGFDEPTTQTARVVIESTSIEVDYAYLMPLSVTGTRANRVTYGRSTPGFVVDARRPGLFPDFYGGATPKVYPGLSNDISLLCGLANGADTGITLEELHVPAQRVTAVTLSYYPRYLYARSDG